MFSKTIVELSSFKMVLKKFLQLNLSIKISPPSNSDFLLYAAKQILVLSIFDFEIFTFELSFTATPILVFIVNKFNILALDLSPIDNPLSPHLSYSIFLKL